MRWHLAEVEEIPDADRNSQVSSPFAGVQSSVATDSRKIARPGLWMGIVALAILAVAAFFVAKTLSDPLRTLKPFPSIAHCI